MSTHTALVLKCNLRHEFLFVATERDEALSTGLLEKEIGKMFGVLVGVNERSGEKVILKVETSPTASNFGLR